MHLNNSLSIGSNKRIDENIFQTDYIPSISDDVYVLGYPGGLKGAHDILPIWKKGSIASEPCLNYDNKPVTLIDCASYSGMSGSPVIIKNKLYVPPSGKFNQSVFNTQAFLGVYSGRLMYNNQWLKEGTIVQTQIGMVWKASTIDEIIALNMAE